MADSTRAAATAPIAFNDLRPQYAALRAELDEAVGRVLQRGWFILGPELEAFEAEFAAYCGARHAVGVGSGTDALHLALRACGVGPGDEVVTVAFTAVPTVNAISLAGARPVFVDVDPTTRTMDPARVEAALTPRTRALLPVHLYGHAADMAPLRELAERRGLWLIEDAAQAHGTRYRGQRTGTLGHLAAFSFYPTKNLGAYGDAGAVVTDDEVLARRLRLLRNYGQTDRYHHQLEGVNSRLDELQAAILRVKLRHLDAWNTARRERAARYTAALAGLATPREAPWTYHTYHLYVVEVPARARVQQALAAAGIGTLVHYPVPVHLQPAYAHLGVPRGALPVSERLADTVLSLPLYPELPLAEVDRVAAALCEIMARLD
ncbi:MAG TPA: DegT/DnrJ/EryC1/StrS family aminotransferase [Chloroflexota bacterium]|nr:DegT/DnrJ/EryC1/StrS family aminotransferase [Chloroflexota bacterium]